MSVCIGLIICIEAT